MAQERSFDAAGSSESGSNITSRLVEVRDRLADRLHSASDRIRRATGQEQNAIAQSIDDTAYYLSEVDPRKLRDDFREGIRRHPGRSLLIAGAAGLLLGIVVRR